MNTYLLAIDQGTSSSRAMIVDRKGRVIAQAQQTFQQYFPHNGWVEHDAEEIWQTVLDCVRQALTSAKLSASDMACMGLTNQRETTLLWDRQTGEVLHPAIVWQDRRTHEYCQQLQRDGCEDLIKSKTGLCLDPYFSASKLAWLLDHIPQARRRAERGELAFGTIDSFLLWRLTGSQVHATDATNASRTSLFNIHHQAWDDELLDLFQIPHTLLPEVYDCNANFGTCDASHFGAPIPITGVAGDQHAALVGQACFSSGMAKATYGTGCFLVLNTGETAVQSTQGLITTLAYRLNGEVSYSLEGSIFNAGTVIKWLRDQLGLIRDAKQSAELAGSVNDSGGVHFIPAFTGLGAPYWDSEARGAIVGLTLDTQIAHIVRAALEAVCYQTQDLLLAMQHDRQQVLQGLRVDGGMVANSWLTQCLADTTACTVQKPSQIQTTVLGAAWLAGLGAGVYSSTDEITQLWSEHSQFEPMLDAGRRAENYANWQQAVTRVR